MLAKGQMMPERHRMPVVIDGRNASESDQETPTLQHGSHQGSPSLNAQPLILDNHAQDGRLKPSEDGSPTLSQKMGQGGNNQPLVLDPYNNDVDEETATLRQGMDKGATVQPVVIQENQRRELRLVDGDGDTAGALSNDPGGIQVNLLLVGDERAVTGEDRTTLSDSEVPSLRENGGHQTLVIKGAAVRANPDTGPQRGEVLEDGSVYTLDTKAPHVVGTEVPVLKRRGGFGYSVDEGEVPTLEAQGGSHEGGPDNLPIVLAFETKGDGSVFSEDEAQTLRSMNYDKSHVNGGGQVAIALTTYETPKFAEDEALTLTTPSPSGGGQPPAVAFDWGNGQSSDRTQIVRTEGGAQVSATRPDALIVKKRLRRLTPVECERLQGFPDHWTEASSDTQRYRQMGNAINLANVRWIARAWKRMVKRLAKGRLHG